MLNRPWPKIAVAAAIVIAGWSTSASASCPQVIFVGQPVLNLGVLSCPSTPDVTHLDVPLGGEVNFANHTGKPATLEFGGASQPIDLNATATVKFTTAGPVTVSMVPECTLDIGKHQAMTVDVAAAAPISAPTAASSPPPGVSGLAVVGRHGSSPPHVVPAAAHAQPTLSPTADAAPTTPTPSGSEYLGLPQKTRHQPPNGLLILIAAVGIICVGFTSVRANIIKWARR